MSAAAGGEVMDVSELAAALEKLLPEAKGGLYISKDDHKASYMSVEEFTEATKAEWVSDAERDRAYATDSYWEIQWYPNTPISSYCIYASTLEAALKALPPEGE